MTGQQRAGFLWALGATFGVAIFVIPWKVAAGLGPSHTNTLLLLIAAASFNSLLSFVQQKRWPRFDRFDLAIAAALAALTLAGNLASAHAIHLLSPSLLTVMQRSEAIIVALLAWPLIGERVDRRYWLGAAVALVGLVVLSGSFHSGAFHLSGMVWAMTSALCFGAMAVLTRKYIHRFDAVSVNALRLWVAIAMWFAWYGLPESLGEIHVEQAFYVSLAAIAGPFLGRLSMMKSAEHLEARYTSLTLLAAPPLTVLLGYALLDDLPSAREGLGGAIMLLGIAIPVLGFARSARARQSGTGT